MTVAEMKEGVAIVEAAKKARAAKDKLLFMVYCLNTGRLAEANVILKEGIALVEEIAALEKKDG